MQRRINLQNYKALAVLFQISYSSYKVKVSINLVFFSMKYFVLVVIQSRKKKKEKNYTIFLRLNVPFVTFSSRNHALNNPYIFYYDFYHKYQILKMAISQKRYNLIRCPKLLNCVQSQLEIRQSGYRFPNLSSNLLLRFSQVNN